MKLSYKNPVWPGYFADPFVLLHDGVYWAYGTGHGPEADGRQFPVLRSRDLAHWEYAGGALLPPGAETAESFTAYWAPEVAERGGKFYLYYSAATGGRDETHRLRVATAGRPDGPFADKGLVKLPAALADVFCIDGHPFRDPIDGKWFLFFARDFFDQRVGTGTAVVPLADDMRSAAGDAITVLRASADWQIYERERSLYGKVWKAWHTVEGPFVWPHAGRYYCFYSGGNWHTKTYGVGFGVAERAIGPYRDDWSQEGPAVLRGVEEKVVGPGHCCVIVGPDEREYLVYHAWDPSKAARRMFIDPLIWTPGGPRCEGPSIG